VTGNEARPARGNRSTRSFGKAIGWCFNSNRELLGPEQPGWNVHHGGVPKGAYSWLMVYPQYGIAMALNANARLDDLADFMGVERAVTRRLRNAILHAEGGL
jgi:CubicO group peptidase (beta-lactamase class C family)